MKQPVVNFPVSFPIIFPITLTGQWQTPNAEHLSLLSERLKNWLLDESSLTARLKSRCENFHVKIIGQQQQLCSVAEASDFINAGEPILVREVILYCDNVPQVFARSLLPLASLIGKEQVFTQLGEKPLGQVLFNNPSLQRIGLELSLFPEDSSVAKLATTLAAQHATDSALVDRSKVYKELLWGRRSIFMLDNKPLMVAEVFLPNAFAYQ